MFPGIWHAYLTSTGSLCPAHATPTNQSLHSSLKTGPPGTSSASGGYEKGALRLHQVGAGWGTRKQLTGVRRPGQRAQASRRGGGRVLGTGLVSAG